MRLILEPRKMFHGLYQVAIWMEDDRGKDTVGYMTLDRKQWNWLRKRYPDAEVREAA